VDLLTSGLGKRVRLQVEVLLGRADPHIPDQRHPSRPFVRFAVRQSTRPQSRRQAGLADSLAAGRQTFGHWWRIQQFATTGHPDGRQKPRMAEKASPPIPNACEQTANSEFATRSTARGAHHHGEEIRYQRSTKGDVLALFPQQCPWV